MTSAVASVAIQGEESAPTTRCRILATAERSFREIGYQKTTVADIAKTLKMSPANVYRFFDSKKAINEAVVERLIGEVEALISGIADRPGSSAGARLSAVIAALHRDTLERCRAFPRMHEMIEAAMSESWEVCRHHVDRIGAVFERIVVDGVRRGEFETSDPAAAARCLHTAIARYSHPILVSQYPDAPVPDLAVMTTFLLRSLRPGDCR
ncbi:TetR/AcrR family transcriptional regulator [uncultured Methylobacterium sp.]|uniref:TetR/AcrR family transcriptional regulator n=1 Tax=uncultured Methylobacterium sp. TaxID=157278 RepID=UPI0035CB8910